MNARDKLLKLLDEKKLDPDEVLRDILVNYLDIDQANECAESELTDHGFDDDDEEEED